MAKTTNTCRKINAILTNAKINFQKLANTQDYKLATFHKNIVSKSKNKQKVLFWREATFLTHTV